MVPHDSDHYMYTKKIDGVTTVLTKMSHNHQEINDTLALLMGRQCYLQLREFTLAEQPGPIAPV